MTDNAGATRASTTVNLGGETYTLAPLRVADLGQLERWAQDEILAREYRAAENLSGDTADRVIGRAHEQASRMTLSSPQFERWMDSYRGGLLALYISLSRSNESITSVEDTEAVIGTPEEFGHAILELMALSFPQQQSGGDGSGKKRSKKKAGARKSRSR